MGRLDRTAALVGLAVAHAPPLDARPADGLDAVDVARAGGAGASGMVRQNAFARRIGLRLLRFVVLLVMASVLVQVVASVALNLVQSGVLAPRRSEDAP